MHNRKVFVYTDVNYGASKTSATQNTATDPSLLAVGSVGIYGIHETGSTNLNKMVLITDGGSEAAGLVPAASFVGREVFIARGTSTGVFMSNPIQLKAGLRASTAGKYSAPVRGVLRLGYNGTVGTSFNFPGTINLGDDFSIQLFNRNYFVSGGREPGQKVLLSYGTTQGQTPISVLHGWVAMVNGRTDDILIDKTKIKILHNGTGAVFANSATVAAVNGATSLTTSAAHGVTAGDAVSLGGDYYISTTGTTGSTLVLTRAYQGATATIANADTLDITGAATQFGLELVDQKDFYNVEAALNGIVNTGTILRFTLPTPGTGSEAEVINLEKEALGKYGTEDQITRYIPIKSSQVASGGTYDLYYLTVRNDDQPGGDQGAVFKVINYLTLAFLAGIADSANKNQSDFEDAMTSLFTTFPAISA
jgi:hypothetical protein